LGATLAPQGDPSNLEMMHLWKADKYIEIQQWKQLRFNILMRNGKRNESQLGNVLSVEK